MTWWFGLPSSSSHALIGGVVGATVVASGTDAVLGDGIVSKVIVPALASPIPAGAIAALGVLVVYAMIKRFQEERGARVPLGAGRLLLERARTASRR